MENTTKQSPIEKAWEIYHGPIDLEDGEEPYLPPPPTSFMRGFVDGVEHARRHLSEEDLGRMEALCYDYMALTSKKPTVGDPTTWAEAKTIANKLRVAAANLA